MAIEKNTKERLTDLSKLRKQSREGGGKKRVDQQHSKGKLTARERIDLLIDEGSFQELDPFVSQWSPNSNTENEPHPGDSVVTGYGTVNGRYIYLYSQDFTIYGGSLSEVAAKKICKVMDMAIKNGYPIVGLIDSGGAKIQEGVVSLAGYGDIFLRNTMASGVIPQISVILGPCAGGAVYSPAITDFVFIADGIGQMYITGPDVIKAATGETVTHEALGGASTHATMSGLAHFRLPDEQQTLNELKRLLSFLPQNNMEDPPFGMPDDDPARIDESLEEVVPDDPVKAYDMKDIISSIVDNADFMEVHKEFAANIIVGFARMGGAPVGIVGQQPSYLAGVLDIDASDKSARFVRFCDAFNIPIITLVDVPGYLPGSDQEHRGIIRHGAKLIFAYAEATVPKITLITRKAYGGAYIVMGSKHLRADVNLAWPTAEIAVMGPDGAVSIVNREQIAQAKDPDKVKAKLVEEYREQFAHPYIAAARGYIDDVIEPKETRPRIIAALEMLGNKRDSVPPKKHGIIPL
ncbi:methylmalonyl-CoA carboxyltransferase [SAR202 cluster bacterium AD-493-K16_JPT_193m]|nr:methylmalonyl-CoA carboxyltransferase [SAR202 cluster bacterium AD-493-K16_JPT_193m]